MSALALKPPALDSLALKEVMLQPSPSEPVPVDETPVAQPQRAEPPALDIDPEWRAGKKLAEARRQLGISLQEASDKIRVRSEFLAALEAMNIKLLPGKAYALAYLKSYAQLLGLDPVAIVEQFQAESALTREDAQSQIRAPVSRPHPERPWLAALAIVVVAAGFVAWRAFASAEQDHPADAAQSAQAPTTRLAAAPAAEAGAPRRDVEIRALTEAWLEARGPDGTVFLSRTLQPGDVYRPDPSPGWKLHAHDGAAFEVLVDGVVVGPLGEAGKPVLGKPIDEIAAPAGASAPAT
jgi:cytoskeleton protein RodZ